MCKLIFFQIGKIGALYITDSNSVEFVNIDFFLVEKLLGYVVRFPNPLASGSGLGERSPKKVVF